MIRFQLLAVPPWGRRERLQISPTGGTTNEGPLLVLLKVRYGVPPSFPPNYRDTTTAHFLEMMSPAHLFAIATSQRKATRVRRSPSCMDCSARAAGAGRSCGPDEPWIRPLREAFVGSHLPQKAKKTWKRLQLLSRKMLPYASEYAYGIRRARVSHGPQEI